MSKQSSEPEFEYHIQFPSPKDVNGVTTTTKTKNVNSTADGDSGDSNAHILKRNGAILENGDDNDIDMVQDIWPWPVTEHTSATSNGSIPNCNTQKDLVVILLGWAGSQHKYLTKYSDIYLGRGCIVLRYITPIKLLFSDVDKIGTMTSQLLQVIKDLQLEEHPLIFHVFSNGGGLTYSSFIRELAIDGVELDIRGTIFDSAPSPRSMLICFKALVNIYAHMKWFRYILSAGIVLMLIFSIFWYHLKTAARFCLSGDNVSANGRNGTIKRDDGPSQNWLSRISHFKHHHFLFIYSEADELIAADKVEQFASILAKRGNHVKYLKFADSPHVKHFMMYPKEYVNSIVSFIRGVMADGPNRTEIERDF